MLSEKCIISAVYNYVFKCVDKYSREAVNAMDAMTQGASDAAKTVVALTVQVIAFMSIYECLDSTIAWLGARVGLDLNFSVCFISFTRTSK